MTLTALNLTLTDSYDTKLIRKYGIEKGHIKHSTLGCLVSACIYRRGIFMVAKFSAAENSTAVLSKFHHNSVVENNPTSAYTIIIFINRTSTSTIAFNHHNEGR